MKNPKLAEIWLLILMFLAIAWLLAGMPMF